MQFSDSETQKLLRDTARSYLADKFPWDRLYPLHHGEAQLTEADLSGFAELGWFGLTVPESMGGGGASLLDSAAVIEEFGYAAVPAPVMAGAVVARLLYAAGPSDALDEHLSNLASGKRSYTISDAVRRLGRPPAEQPAASDGKLSGTLPMVPFAGASDFVLAPITVDGEAALALIPLDGTRLEPVALLDRPDYFNLQFENVSLDTVEILARGEAAIDMHERYDALVTALSLIELGGMMQRVLEMTTEFVTNRVQFGKPIGTFQAVRHRAAELLMQTETTRWAAYHALWRFQKDPEDTEEIWSAKQWAIRAVDRVYQVSHLLHGGVGVGTEYPLHLFTQSVVSFAVRGGTMGEMVDRTIASIKRRQAVGAK